MKQASLAIPKKEVPNLAEVELRLKKMEVTFDEAASLVIDTGTDTIKSGFSGEPLPRVFSLPQALA